MLNAYWHLRLEHCSALRRMLGEGWCAQRLLASKVGTREVVESAIACDVGAQRLLASKVGTRATS